MVVLRALEWWHSREQGATSAEYALMISGIAMVLVAATYTLGDDLASEWEELAVFVQGLGSPA